jgi:hypothetical protein
MRQFGTPQSGRVERHQKNPVKPGWSGINEFRYLLYAEDLGKPKSLPRIGCFSNGPRFLQRRHEEESKRSSSLVDCVGSQSAFTK